MRAVSLLIALGVSSCVLGGDECKVGENRCDGAAIARCQRPCSEIGCSATIQRELCSGVCVELSGHFPVCAISNQPDPGCAGTRGYCDGTQLTVCAEGYALSKTDCAPAAVCVVDQSQHALCALSKQRESPCAPAANGDACAGTELVGCDDGFIISRQPCSQACAAPGAERAFCGPSSTPDPSCLNMTQSGFYCVGDTLSQCDEGYAREYQNCATAHLVCEAQPELHTINCVAATSADDAGTPARDR